MSLEIKLETESHIRDHLLQIEPFQNHSMNEEEILSMYVLHLTSLCYPISKVKLINQLNWSLGSFFDKDKIIEVLDAHLAHQNLVISSTGNKEIYISPLRYVISDEDQDNKKYILIGVGAQDQTLGCSLLEEKLKFSAHIRYWKASDFDSEEELRNFLRASYIQPVSKKTWIGIEDFIEDTYQSGYTGFIDLLNRRLASDGTERGSFLNQEYLDPSSANNGYYKARWKQIEQCKDTTHCIIRFERNYTRNYRYALIGQGKVIKSLHLNQLWDKQLKDEKSIAWMIQKAIDMYNDIPQAFKYEALDEEYTEIKWFHPVPSWIERKISAIGHRIERKEGDYHLFSYKIPTVMLDLFSNDLKKYWIDNER